MGAYLELVTPGIPLLGAWIYSGPYAIPSYSVTFTGVFTHTTPTDAYRGAGRPEATYVLERTMDALARELGHGSRRASSEELRHGVPAHDGLGADDRLGRLCASLDRCSSCSIWTRSEPIRRRRRERRRREADRRRLLDLQRDVRARAVAHPRSDPLRGGRLGRRHDPLPAARLGPGGDRYVAARSEPRDDLGADRRRPARRRRRRRRGAPRRHGGVPAGHGHRTGAGRSRSAASRSYHASAEDDREGSAASSPTSSRSPRTTSSSQTGTFTVKGSPDRTMAIQAVAFAAHTAHNLPDGMEPGLEETAVYDPPNFSWPAGAHAAVVEVDTETGDTRLVRYVAVDDVGSSGEPADHRRAGARWHHAGHRGGALRGRRVRRRGQPAHDDDGRPISSRPRRSSRRYETDRTETAADNPLGVKGVGETGTIAAAPAVINAVVDALSHLGVTDCLFRPRRRESGRRSRR